MIVLVVVNEDEGSVRVFHGFDSEQHANDTARNLIAREAIDTSSWKMTVTTSEKV